MKRIPDSMVRTCDKLWEYLVKSRAGFRCEMGGGAREGLDAHHIISRGNYWTRWDLRNGICISRELHNTADVLAWLKANRPKQYRWIMREKRKLRHGSKPDLDKIYQKLLAA